MPISDVRNMDCMDFMKEFPDKYFDLAIVDPPYGIGQGGSKINSKTVKKDGSLIKKYDKRNGAQIITKPKKYHNNYSDNQSPPLSYFNELLRVSKNQIIWGANHFISKIPYDSSCWIIWDKVNGNSDQSDCELAWTSFKTAVRKFEYMWTGLLQGKSIYDGRINQGNKKLCEERIHPNQKPIALYEWLLRNYAERGNIILDTHLGGGGSRIASYKLGYNFYATELDKYFFDAQEKRFNESISMPLFDNKEDIKQLPLL